MGLYLQCDQEVPAKPQFCLARPICCYYDSTFHGCLRQATYQDLPQKRRTRYGQPLSVTS